MKPGSDNRNTRQKDLHNYLNHFNLMSRFLLALAKAETQLATRSLIC